MSDRSRWDKEAQNEVLPIVLVGATITVVGVVVLSFSIPAQQDSVVFLGIFLTLMGIGVALREISLYRRWAKWYKRARPYKESKRLLYPYNPYPNVTCWNCGHLVRRPAPPSTGAYVKPLWTRFNGRWKAFCSSCGANVTKEVVEAKYGNPYRGRIWPKFYKPTSVLSSTRICPNCGKDNHKRLQNCESCGAPMATEAS